MSSLRIKLERERIEAAEKGKPAPQKQDSPAVRRTYTRRDAADAAISRPRGYDLRSRLGQPQQAPPEPVVTLTPDQILWQRGVEEQNRRNQETYRAHEQRQREQKAEQTRQRIESQRASEKLNESLVEDVVADLTLAEHAEVERRVRDQYNGSTEPAIWDLAAKELRIEVRVCGEWGKLSPEFIKAKSNQELADFLSCSTNLIERLRW